MRHKSPHRQRPAPPIDPTELFVKLKHSEAPLFHATGRRHLMALYMALRKRCRIGQSTAEASDKELALELGMSIAQVRRQRRDLIAGGIIRFQAGIGHSRSIYFFLRESDHARSLRVITDDHSEVARVITQSDHPRSLPLYSKISKIIRAAAEGTETNFEPATGTGSAAASSKNVVAAADRLKASGIHWSSAQIDGLLRKPPAEQENFWRLLPEAKGKRNPGGWLWRAFQEGWTRPDREQAEQLDQASRRQAHAEQGQLDQLARLIDFRIGSSAEQLAEEFARVVAQLHQAEVDRLAGEDLEQTLGRAQAAAARRWNDKMLAGISRARQLPAWAVIEKQFDADLLAGLELAAPSPQIAHA